MLELRQILIGVGIVLLPMVLVAVEPDMGGAAMYAPLMIGMLLVAGIRVRLLVTAALVGLVLVAGLWAFGLKGYQRQRVLTFMSPETDPLGAGYQVRQSKIAVGSGELVGKGYMQGTQSQLRFLPARHTDFILSVLAEEWGFLGVATVLGLFVALHLERGPHRHPRPRPRRHLPGRRADLDHLLPRALQQLDGGGVRPHHRHPPAVPLLRRLVHHDQLHLAGDHPGGRHPAGT